MPNLPTALVLIETLVLVFVLVNYFKLKNQLTSLKEKENKLKNADYAKRRAEKILENARSKYQEVIDDSYTKAEKIIRDAKVFNDQTKDEVLAELKQTIRSISTEIKNEALEEVKEYGQELEEEVKAGEEATRRVIAEDHDKVEKELAEYKQTKLAEVDAQVRKVVQDAAREIIGEAIDLDKHPELVIKALEGAKRQNIV